MNGVLRRVEELSPERRAEMRALLDRHFSGVSDEAFEADLRAKSWALLFEEDGVLVGFSTLLLYPFTYEGAAFTVVYSGDTIVDPAARGSSALPRSWIDAVRRLHASEGAGRLIWLLLTSGYRTYRFLPVFWRNFHPRYDAAIPPRVAALRDALAHEHFGAAYDAAAGIVRFPSPQQLRDPLLRVPEERLADPHVAFFQRANPGHARGDELVCITELSDENLTRAGWRMVKAGATRRAAGTPL